MAKKSKKNLLVKLVPADKSYDGGKVRFFYTTKKSAKATEKLRKRKFYPPTGEYIEMVETKT